MPLFETIFVIVSAIKLLQSALRSTSQQIEREQREIDEFRRNGIDELKRKIQDKSFKARKHILHEAKNGYVAKSNVYYNLSREYDVQIKDIKEQKKEINEYKSKLFREGRHEELKEWKAKTKELDERFDELVAQFNDMSRKMREYNGIVKEIKGIIENSAPN